MILPFKLSLFLLQAHGATEPTDLWGQIVHSNLINILLIVILLVWVAKKQNIGAGIDAQREKIAGDILEADRQKKEAQAQLDKIQQQTARLQSEVDEILNTARQSAESMSAKMLEDARTEASKIVDNAKKRVEQEQRSALNGLQARLLDEAISDARQELANTLTPQDQRRSVDAFLEELSKTGLSAGKGGRH